MRIQRPQPSLSDQQLTTLHARFVVPIAIQMIMNDSEQLDEACETALHQCLSELQPDTGLLCLALCAQHVAAAAPESPIVNMLAISATRIADEYGAALLAEAGHPTMQSAPLSHEEALRLLHQVPEDLEELATLLDAVLADSDPHSPEGLLCDILSVQAMVHAERAGHELAALSAAAQSPQPSTRTATTKTAQKARKIEYIDKNVIAFPH